MALSIKNRLSLRENRGKFFESGRSLYSPLLQLIVLKADTSSRHSGLDPESIKIIPSPQFAVSISKKVAKKAHDRNLLRRQIQQLIQTNTASFPPFKYLFLPKKSAVNSYPGLLDSFNQLLSKLKA